MGFTEAVRTCLRKTFVLSGRAPRSEYWWFVLFYVLYIAVAGAVFYGIALAMNFSTLTWVIGALLALPAVWFYVASLFASVRRLHDRGFSGWWIGASMIVGAVSSAVDGQAPDGPVTLALGAVSIVLSITILVMTILRGTQGPNKYGEDPLGYVDEAVFA